MRVKMNARTAQSSLFEKNTPALVGCSDNLACSRYSLSKYLDVRNQMIASELFGTAPCGTPFIVTPSTGRDLRSHYGLRAPPCWVSMCPTFPATCAMWCWASISSRITLTTRLLWRDHRPVANRTAGATIAIAGTDWHMPANEGVNNLHSDLEHGLHKRVWDVGRQVLNAVRMTTSLKDGELGLPGNRTAYGRVYRYVRRCLPLSNTAARRPRHLRVHDQPHIL